MPELHLRPRFRFALPYDSGTVVERVRRQMRRNNPADLKLRSYGDHLVLRFPSHVAHMWTPQMRIDLEDVGTGGTLVHTIIGPSSRIWQFFLGSLTAVITIGIMGLLVGFVQWSNGADPWGFYLAVIGLSGSLFLFFLSKPPSNVPVMSATCCSCSWTMPSTWTVHAWPVPPAGLGPACVGPPSRKAPAERRLSLDLQPLEALSRRCRC